MGTHSILNLNLTATFSDWKKKVFTLTNACFWPRSHGSTTRSHTKNRSVAIIISIIRSSASPFRKVFLASETIGTWPRHDIVIGVNGEASISYHKIFVIWPLASFGTWTAMHCRQNLKVKKKPQGSQFTVWKCREFSCLQILREINYGKFKASEINFTWNSSDFQIPNCVIFSCKCMTSWSN